MGLGVRVIEEGTDVHETWAGGMIGQGGGMGFDDEV